MEVATWAILEALVGKMEAIGIKVVICINQTMGHLQTARVVAWRQVAPREEI
jgi:hypothetical protein